MTVDSRSEFLREEFLAEAEVIDAKKGYVSAPSFNVRMEPAILKAAGELVAEHFRKYKIDAVHGIPHSGNYLATAVAIALNNGTRLHSSRKDMNIPASWKDVYTDEIRSFTTYKSQSQVFAGINLSFIKKGDRVLLVDDVCAYGETGVRIVEGLKERGVKVVGFAVMFDKVFQGGLEKVAKLGVEAFSCVRIKRLKKDGTVELQ